MVRARPQGAGEMASLATGLGDMGPLSFPPLPFLRIKRLTHPSILNRTIISKSAAAVRSGFQPLPRSRSNHRLLRLDAFAISLRTTRCFTFILCRIFRKGGHLFFIQVNRSAKWLVGTYGVPKSAPQYTETRSHTRDTHHHHTHCTHPCPPQKAPKMGHPVPVRTGRVPRRLRGSKPDHHPGSGGG